MRTGKRRPSSPVSGGAAAPRWKLGVAGCLPRACGHRHTAGGIVVSGRANSLASRHPTHRRLHLSYESPNEGGPSQTGKL